MTENRFIHTSTERGPIRVRAEVIWVDCTVHLFNPVSGISRDIEFEARQEVWSASEVDDFDARFPALLETINSFGRKAAKDFIDAHVAREGRA